MSLEPRELLQEFRCKQDKIAKTLDVEVLPRRRDRILHFSWNDIPLEYNRPRFGVLESERADRVRGGWQVIMTQELQNADTAVFDWVLWREALLGFLLPHLRHIPEAADLGLYTGLLYGRYRASAREALNKIWKQVSPPQHFQHYIYDGPFGFPLFDQVVNGTFLNRVIPWLNTIRPITHIPLTTNAYTTALERWMVETHIPLTQPEHHILTALSQLTTPLHQKRLASQLNMSNASLSQNLTSLAQRHGLRLNHFINLPLIGLTPYELIIQSPNYQTRQRITEIFSHIPYTWLIYTIQETRFYCRVFIPTNNTSQFIDWLTELTQHHDLHLIKLLRTASIIRNWNLEIYVPTQGWPNDFTLQLHKMQTIFNDQDESSIPTLFTWTMSYDFLKTSPKYPVALRQEDFTYFLRGADIHQITDRIAAQASKELHHAGVPETAHMIYRRRIKQLEMMNISQVQGISLFHIGLDTVIQIFIEENRIIFEQVARALSVLPNMRGVIFDDGSGLLLLFVPNQNAVEILSALRQSLIKNDISANIEAKPTWQSFSGFESPVNPKNYDFNKGEWKWERTTLPDIGP